jgi:hypothetical protein
MIFADGKIELQIKSRGAASTAPGETERRARSIGGCMISPLQPPHNKGGYPMPHKDPDAKRAYLREWKRRNAEKVSRWAKEDDARRHANKRAAIYGASGELTLDDVRAVFAAGRCHYCGCSDALMTIDHVIPLHAKGPNTPDYIVVACRTCNLKKRRGDHPDQWSQEHEACCDCRTTDHPYKSNGRCNPCYSRWRSNGRG